MKKTRFQYLVDNSYKRIRRLYNNISYKKSFNIIKIFRREKIEKIISYLFDQSYTPIADLQCIGYVTKEPITFNNKTEGKKVELSTNEKWAEEVFDCAWFNFTGSIPDNYKPSDIVFLINTGGEGLIYDSKGDPKQSITCYASQYDYRLGMPVKKVVINDNLTNGNNVDFWVDAGANDLFGKMKNESRLEEACIASVNHNIRALAYDLEALIAVYDFNRSDKFIKEISNTILGAFKEYQLIDERKALEIRERIKPLLETKNDKEQFEYFAVGHAHLDLAWLWPIRESKRKGARTLATQMLNIKRYPNYVFGASQAQLYQWIKDDYPTIYSKVKELSRTPNLDIQGATWVEMDSNLISGESMIRQFFYGKQFFLKEFGQEMKILWLPDSFGYSACLPQVMKLADVPYFLTQKMSWNTVNKFPYHTFKWQGLDSSEVFAHMLPENTYNSPCRADYLKSGERNYQERKISNKSIMLFGIGDGGAGPGFEHIERMYRYNDLKGMPKVTPKKSYDSFKLLDDKTTKYSTHNGELYLERHQGTYTTQSKNKMYNRKCEFTLRNYEILMVQAIDNNIEPPIKKKELDDIWKEILLYQFHDILPGSSINRVYDESIARYIILYDRLEMGIEILSKSLISGYGIMNFNSYDYNVTIKKDNNWFKVTVPSIGYTFIDNFTRLDKFESLATDNSIENDKIRISFKNGYIVSLYDKILSREFVKKGKSMGVYTQYIDNGDCWDIKPNYKKSRKVAKFISFKTGTDGAMAYADIDYVIDKTIIKSRISIIEGDPLVRFDINIECCQKARMLRAEFPTNILTDECNFNIQFGHISRKTTSNNSIEKAQFEVSGQKFVDISDDNSGLSLLNDCKYGYRCKDGMIDINLIRSPKGGPGQDVDQGLNSFTLALLPHMGKLGIDTYSQAYLLNNPLRIIDNGEGLLSNNTKLYESNNDNIVLESVKIAEHNGIILRLYNSSASEQKANIEYIGYKAIELVGVMENSICAINDALIFKAFELKLVRFIKE